MVDLERELDRLYGLPPDEFTRARNELAKRLRDDGDRDSADQVRALGKPTVAAWAVNQLARRRQAGVSELLDAAAALRSAQGRALAGGGGDSVRRAAAHRADAIRKLTGDARELLEEAGLKATDATIERVSTTLSATSIDDEGRRLLSRGRLASEQTPKGFEAIGDLPSEPKRREPRTAAAKQRAEAAERKRRLRELETEARRLDREAEKAKREAERAGREAKEATARAEAARTSAEEAAERAAKAAKELARAKRAG